MSQEASDWQIYPKHHLSGIVTCSNLIQKLNDFSYLNTTLLKFKTNFTRYRMSFYVYNPLAGGMLTGKHSITDHPEDKADMSGRYNVPIYCTIYSMIFSLLTNPRLSFVYISKKRKIHFLF